MESGEWSVECGEWRCGELRVDIGVEHGETS